MTDWPEIHENVVRQFRIAWEKPEPHAWDGFLDESVRFVKPMLRDGVGPALWWEVFARTQALLPDLRVEVLRWAGAEENVFVHIRFVPTADSDVAREVGLDPNLPIGVELALDVLLVGGGNGGFAANMVVIGIAPDQGGWFAKRQHFTVELDGAEWWTGKATGVHLHWAIVKNGHYVNPKNYVDGQPFRPRSSGSATSAASCDDVWIANVDGAVTAAVTEGDNGAGGSDTICAA